MKPTFSILNGFQLYNFREFLRYTQPPQYRLEAELLKREAEKLKEPGNADD